MAQPPPLTWCDVAAVPPSEVATGAAWGGTPPSVVTGPLVPPSPSATESLPPLVGVEPEEVALELPLAWPLITKISPSGKQALLGIGVLHPGIDASSK